jgi:hypothetical protein
VNRNGGSELQPWEQIHNAQFHEMSKKKRKNNQHALQTGTNLYGVLQVQR